MTPDSLPALEFYTFVFVLGACAISLPTLIKHMRGSTDVITQATFLMARTEKYQKRLAGGMHLTWLVLFSGSLGVLLKSFDYQSLGEVAGLVFFVSVILGLSVFFLGRPKTAMLRRFRS